MPEGWVSDESLVAASSTYYDRRSPGRQGYSAPAMAVKASWPPIRCPRVINR